ncbi:MAG: YndJ family transporter [Archangium sp.]
MTLAQFMIPVMNIALVTGVGIVLPLALREKLVPWLVAAVCVGISMNVDGSHSTAVAFVVPWTLLTVRSGLRALLDEEWWLAMAAGFAGTASIALITSRLQATPFGITEPIVKLTALHFTYAGAGTLMLAQRLNELRPSRLTRVTRWLVFIAPPIVATGFVTRISVAQVGGALVMTAGVWLVATQQFSDAVRGRARVLWWLSSLAPWVAMVLGVAWAANLYWPSIPALTVVDMVPTHGALNAFGFVLCGHVAAWLETRER